MLSKDNKYIIHLNPLRKGVALEVAEIVKVRHSIEVSDLVKYPDGYQFSYCALVQNIEVISKFPDFTINY